MARIINIPAFITAKVTAKLTTARQEMAGKAITPELKWRRNETTLCTEIDRHCVGRAAGWRV